MRRGNLGRMDEPNTNLVVEGKCTALARTNRGFDGRQTALAIDGVQGFQPELVLDDDQIHPPGLFYQPDKYTRIEERHVTSHDQGQVVGCCLQAGVDATECTDASVHVRHTSIGKGGEPFDIIGGDDHFINDGAEAFSDDGDQRLAVEF